MNFEFSRTSCLNLESSLRKEWYEADGLGGYAGSTLIDCPTRKYHSLLAAPVPTADARINFLAKVEVSLLVDGQSFRLATSKYPGVYHPTGHKYIESARCELHPQLSFRVADIRFRREIMMVRGQHTTLICYTLESSDKPLTVHLQPLLAYRDIHGLTRENMALRVKTYVTDGCYKMDPYAGLPPLYLDTSVPTLWHPGPHWLHNIEYIKERTRGYDYQEDLFAPGIVEVKLQAGDSFVLRASLTAPGNVGPEAQWQTERSRRRALRASGDPLPLQVLKARGEQFFIRNVHGDDSIVAGYPWFAEWGRDAMIALPGLAFVSGREELGLSVLRGFARHQRDGLIPNFLGLQPGGHAYNAVDASLWFFWAAQSYLAHSGDRDGLDEAVGEAMTAILSAFIEGRVPHVVLQDSGLLAVGDRHTQLTWMDAQVHGRPVTPRHGLAVELNALWYNALCFYAEFNDDCPANWLAVRDRAGSSFAPTFWRDELQYLLDVVNEDGEDAAIRPNQVFAVSLPHSALSRDQQRAVLACLERHLLTPYGLRTLSPRNPNYAPLYKGSQESRDAAYHQGPVWAWLLGHYVSACVATSDDPEATRRQLREQCRLMFETHLRDGCVGSVSELFNPDPPYRFKGCPHQAWSVGEVIRAWTILDGGQG